MWPNASNWMRDEPRSRSRSSLLFTYSLTRPFQRRPLQARMVNRALQGVPFSFFSFSRVCSEPKYLSFAVLGWPGMKITNSAWSATTVGGMNTEAIAGGTRCVVKKTRGA